MADLVVATPSQLDKYKTRLAEKQAQVAALEELIQRLEANPELLRVMELVKFTDGDNY